MKDGGKEMSDGELRDLIQQVDTDNNGEISLDEFKEVFKLAPDSMPPALQALTGASVRPSVRASVRPCERASTPPAATSALGLTPKIHPRSDVGGLFLGGLSAVAGATVEIGGKAVGAVGDGLGTAGNALGNGITAIGGGGLVDATRGGLGAVGDVGGNAVGAVGDGFNAVGDLFGDLFGSKPEDAPAEGAASN